MPESITTVVTDPVIPGVFVSLIAVVVVSLATNEPSNRTLAPFFADVADRTGATGEDVATDGGSRQEVSDE